MSRQRREHPGEESQPLENSSSPLAGGWLLLAEREGEPVLEERVHRQGTAYRRARHLYAAGYTLHAIQYSIDEPPTPIAAYRFDGIRFVRIPKRSIRI